MAAVDTRHHRLNWLLHAPAAVLTVTAVSTLVWVYLYGWGRLKADFGATGCTKRHA